MLGSASQETCLRVVTLPIRGARTGAASAAVTCV